MGLKKNSEIAKLASETLKTDLHMAQKSLHQKKLDHAIKGLQNPNELNQLRREIAMIQTEIRKRELAN